MNWNTLNDVQQLPLLDQESESTPILILKHSTRCSISAAALSRLERNWQDSDSAVLKPYYLDLLQYRDVSNTIADLYSVEHQSPQVLVIKHGTCVYSATHTEINYAELMSQVRQ